MADNGVYFGNPHTTAQGLKAKLSAGRESEGRLEALVRGLMGEAPDAYGSVLDEGHTANRGLAQGAFGLGTALQVAPLLKGVKGALSLVGTGPVGKSGVRGVIKMPGGNWDKENVDTALRDAGGYGRLQDLDASEHPLTQWVNKNLRNYVTRDMATDRDPVRKLLLEHPEYMPASLQGANAIPGSLLQLARRDAGFPARGASDIPTRGGVPTDEGTPAAVWDNTADRAAMPQTVKAYLEDKYQPNHPAFGKTVTLTPENVDAADAWMLKADPNTPIHSADAQHLTRLGMGHVLDELENATAAHDEVSRLLAQGHTLENLRANDWEGVGQSGNLHDAGLTIDPAKLSRMSVADAYAHVGKIDQWREAQQAVADAARANSRAAVPLKDYGGDKGLKWVELKLPEGLPEGYTVEELTRPTGERIHRITNPQGEVNDFAYQEGMHPDIHEIYGGKDLEDALRYEGEQMRHCVGGYCDDVAGGGTRILSLRDASGKPHATVELEPRLRKIEDRVAELEPGEWERISNEIVAQGGVPPAHGGSRGEWAERVKNALPPEAPTLSINQIKGPSNGPVKPEYQQHVLDLLNGGVPGLDKGWGAVNDLQLQRIVQPVRGPNAGKYVTHDEYLAGENSEPPGGIDVGDGNNYAHGGLVYPTQHGPYGFNRAGRNKAFRKTGYAEGGLIDERAHQAATSPQNDRAEPTEAQKQAGNYKKGPVYLHGMRLSIENPQGSTRSGVDADGEPWESTLNHHYGYLRGTSGRDKDHLDVFLGPEAHNADAPIHVVDQYKPHTGQFDEHKVMLGFPDDQDAIDAYHSNYGQGWRGFGSVTTMDLPTFKRWAFADGRRVKPAAEHSLTAPSDVAEKLAKLKAE